MLRGTSSGFPDPMLDSSPLISTRIRKVDLNKLRLICVMALVNMTPDKLLEFAIEILKKPPSSRIQEEVAVLIKATENMQYFKDLNKKNRHIRSCTHEKICSRIRYEKHSRGHTVLQYGDPASKFYIILKGSVSIYVPRDYLVLQKEIEEKKRNLQNAAQDGVLQKVFQWRAKLKRFIREFPLEESPINRKAFKKLYTKASIQLSPTLVQHLTTDFKIDHEYYYRQSILHLKRASQFPDFQTLLAENQSAESLPQDPESLSPIDEDSEDLETDFVAEKAIEFKENVQEFLRGFNDFERPVLNKLQSMLGEVPLAYLDEPENYFQDGVFKYHMVGVFGPGNIFGEVGLLMRKPRSASVICNNDTEFAILTAEDYGEILEAVDKKEMESRMEFFLANLFQEMQPEVAIRLSYMFKKAKYMKGNYIYRQGEKANDVYLIKKGEIQIYTKIKDAEIEKKPGSVNEFLRNMYYRSENKVKQDKFISIQLSSLGTGQSFGEEDIVFNRNRAYNAVCSSNKVTLFFIPKTHFLKITTENKRIQIKIFNNSQCKENWHRTQIETFFKKRQNNNEVQCSQTQPEIFPIRRDIKEIPGLSIDSDNRPSSKKKQGFHRPVLSTQLSIPKLSTQLSIPKSPKYLCDSPLNSGSKPKTQQTSNHRNNLQNLLGNNKISNGVIRKENIGRNNSESNLNSSIVEIVRKNDKNLEELMKYPQSSKGFQSADFYKLLNEDEAHAQKIAKIMYLYKSKHRNYSNSDVLDSNQKLSIRSVLQSFVRTLRTNEEIDQTPLQQKSSFDFYTNRNSKGSIEPFESKRSPISKRPMGLQKASLSSRGMEMGPRKNSDFKTFRERVPEEKKGEFVKKFNNLLTTKKIQLFKGFPKK